ncbi:uncharacterized protein LOC131856961 [Cryptomeria japonica]|uniref:uncharacterized protein LOC131856961 n=1 Tax=Cryptomeria japonica TaxID=3369 RepID=UPI0027D9E984|nr:uncharacterized protein LOC131856961 [Cryptomeria japonica]
MDNHLSGEWISEEDNVHLEVKPVSKEKESEEIVIGPTESLAKKTIPIEEEELELEYSPIRPIVISSDESEEYTPLSDNEFEGYTPPSDNESEVLYCFLPVVNMDINLYSYIEVRRVGEVRQEAPRVEEQPDNRARIEEEMAKDLKRIAPPKFDGKTIGGGAEAWVIEMEKYFGLRNMSNETKAVWVAYQLSGEAATWWDNEKSERKLQPRDITWELFLQSFRKRWLPHLFFDKKMTEFHNLTQGGMSVTQYWEKFTNLL